MSWTHISTGSATGQGDNGSFAGPSTPSPSSWRTIAQTGDLVVLITHYKGNVTLSMTGGIQTWNALTQQANGTSSVARIFWCVWQADGSDTSQVTVTSGTLALNVIFMIFRPTSGNTVAQDGSVSTGTFTNAAATVTITGRTVAAASTVTVASWSSEDDNTWASLAGSGWTKPLIDGAFAQQRNLQGTDISDAIAYNIQTSAGTLANVSQDMGGVGNDPGIWMTASWSETAPSGFKPRMMLMGVG